MVGGFSESPYLRKTLGEKFCSRGLQVVSTDDGTKKAAAEGAALWYLRESVVARACRAFMGVSKKIWYDEDDKVHASRSQDVYVNNVW